jgi:hypothetical protein
MQGVLWFLRFAQDSGAISREEAEAFTARTRRAIESAAERQADHIEVAEPTDLFLRLVRSSLVRGEAHLAALRGGLPANPAASGWRSDGGTWQPAGRCIGWDEGDDVFLDLQSAFAEAQRVGREIGEEICISIHTLRRRLREKGALASVDGKHLEVKRMIDGVRRRVLHLRLHWLWSELGQMGRGGGDLGGSGEDEGAGAPLPRPTSSPTKGGSATKVGHESGALPAQVTCGAPLAPLPGSMDGGRR